MRPVLVGGFYKQAETSLTLSFINYILLISRKIQLEGGEGLRARVARVRSLYLNQKIDIYIHETPGGAHDEVMRGVS